MLPIRDAVKRPVLLAFVLVLALAVMTGCSFNLFRIFHGGGGESYKGLVAQGDDAYAAGDYQLAAEKYSAAIDADPEGSRARVGYVNAFCRIHFVDFLYIAQRFGQPGFNPTDLLNDPIVKNGVIGAGGVFQVTIDTLDDIAYGACDEEVPSDDFGVNLQLALSYLFRGLVKIVDSNGNGTNADPGDILTIDASGVPMFNPGALNFDLISSSLSNAATPGTGITPGGGSPLDVFASIGGGFGSLTNMTYGTDTDYRYFLEAIHDSVEVSMNLLKTIKNPFDYIDKAFAALNRIADRYDYNSIVTNVTAPVQRLYDQVNGYKQDIDSPYAVSFNAFHRSITGVDASWDLANVSTFNYSAFSWHLRGQPGGPAGLMAPLNDSWSVLWGTSLSMTNITGLSNVIEDALSSFTNIDLTTLMGQWFGGLAGGF